jgi:hypothetical protein
VYNINKNILIVNDNSVCFDFDIREVKVLDKLIIVLLSIPFDVNFLNNVYAVDMNGKLVWQIQDVRDLYPKNKVLPYEHIRINENNQIVVVNFYGIAYTVNPLSGKIIGRSFTK